MPSYTLNDLRRDRAQYEAEMAALDEKRWAAIRTGFKAMRRLPVTGTGNLAGATFPKPTKPNFIITEVN